MTSITIAVVLSFLPVLLLLAWRLRWLLLRGLLLLGAALLWLLSPKFRAFCRLSDETRRALSGIG